MIEKTGHLLLAPQPATAPKLSQEGRAGQGKNRKILPSSQKVLTDRIRAEAKISRQVTQVPSPALYDWIISHKSIVHLQKKPNWEQRERGGRKRGQEKWGDRKGCGTQLEKKTGDRQGIRLVPVSFRTRFRSPVFSCEGHN